MDLLYGKPSEFLTCFSFVFRKHILADHNPYVACHNCWKSFRTTDEARAHQNLAKCSEQRRPYPEAFWITSEVLETLRPQRLVEGKTANGRKWKGTPSENWYELFEMLHPTKLQQLGSREIRQQYIPCTLASPATVQIGDAIS